MIIMGAQDRENWIVIQLRLKSKIKRVLTEIS